MHEGRTHSLYSAFWLGFWHCCCSCCWWASASPRPVYTGDTGTQFRAPQPCSPLGPDCAKYGNDLIACQGYKAGPEVLVGAPVMATVSLRYNLIAEVALLRRNCTKKTDRKVDFVCWTCAPFRVSFSAEDGLESLLLLLPQLLQLLLPLMLLLHATPAGSDTLSVCTREGGAQATLAPLLSERNLAQSQAEERLVPCRHDCPIYIDEGT